MDATIEFSTILALAGAVSVIGGAWLTVRKLNADYKKTRDLEAAKILQSAKEEINKAKMSLENSRSLIVQELEGKIKAVQQNLENLQDSTEKDLNHMRETYNGEIRNLGNKIEDLREELRNQHGQLVGLLTKMIDRSE